MTEAFEKRSDGTKNMDDVGRLIKLVGARELVQGERLERARQNVRAHWQEVVAEQRVAKPPRRFKFIAIAASIVVVAGVSLMLWNLSIIPTRVSLASVDRVLGQVLIADAIAGKDTAISANTSIVTDTESRIAIRMSGGQSLRIDTASHVTIHSSNHVSLEAGAIYIDTAISEEAEPILVSTPLGTARDIGTQFQVRLTGMMLVVGVRQGLVEVSQTGQQSLSINKGHYVELDANGESKEQALLPDDPDWEWVETVAPEFDIQGASLEQYLQWFARERGVNLEWADGVSEANARTVRLAGSIAGASLEQSLVIVKQVAPFEHRISGDVLWVNVK